MTDHPTIPLDPALRAEVAELYDLAQQLMTDHLAPLTERIGAVMLKVDQLEEALDHDDEAVNEMRRLLGYGQLMAAMEVMASHATAAADEPSGVYAVPAWYDRLRHQRRVNRWGLGAAV